MINWEQFTLLTYVIMRMAGFVVFNPLFARGRAPSMLRSGFALMLAFAVMASLPAGAGTEVPRHLLEYALRLVLELGLGFVVGFVMQLFFYIPNLAVRGGR